jgi:hypothetical protein
MKRMFFMIMLVPLSLSLVACSHKSSPPSAAAGTRAPDTPSGTRANTGNQPESLPPPANPRSAVFINGRELSSEQTAALLAAYRYTPPPGRYWYDAMSGAWGIEGRETLGFILPGHDFGPVAADASAGNTGVFINGREINLVEAAALQRTFGAVYRGHWWLDGRTGNFGVAGNPVPVGNLIAIMRAQQNNGRGGDNFWSSATARGNSSGGCSYVSVDGATATSGCD